MKINLKKNETLLNSKKIKVKAILLHFWKCNFPMNHNVCLFVGLSVFQSVFRSAGLSKNNLFLIIKCSPHAPPFHKVVQFPSPNTNMQ